jgi:8-oxo-dGTP diphosphatase
LPLTDYKFCPLCGKGLGKRKAGGRLRDACDCGYVNWANPVPAAGMFILRGEECLWVRRAEEPFKGQWSMPSGFQEWEEDIRDCAVREVLEETGLQVETGALIGVYSAFDDPRNNALLVVYLGRVTGGREAAGDDASELGWFPLESPPEPVAWEPHRRALADLVELLHRGEIRSEG